MTTILVTGATGFVGTHLTAQLVSAGHLVRAMTRRPESYAGAGLPVAGDVSDPGSLTAALAGIDVAYYLVHALAHDDFVERDATAARAFGAAAARAGVRQIIYVGGLGAEQDGSLSEHLRSRREVEGLLGESGVPVTTLRAAIVIGHGGISWEITRQLVANLPAMVAPRWALTKCQPIAISDMIRYLLGVLDHPEALGQTYDVGGPDVLSYAEMMRRVSRLRLDRALPIMIVPLLTPRLSSRWLSLITDVDTETARNLIESMNNEVIMTETSIHDLVPGTPLGFDDAVRAAFAQREAALASEA